MGPKEILGSLVNYPAKFNEYALVCGEVHEDTFSRAETKEFYNEVDRLRNLHNIDPNDINPEDKEPSL